MKDIKIFLLIIKLAHFFIKYYKKNNKYLQKIDPIYFFKSQKNRIEIKNTKKIHEYDGAALT